MGGGGGGGEEAFVKISQHSAFLPMLEMRHLHFFLHLLPPLRVSFLDPWDFICLFHPPSSPRYNCTGWLGVKHQLNYFILPHSWLNQRLLCQLPTEMEVVDLAEELYYWLMVWNIFPIGQLRFCLVRLNTASVLSRSATHTHSCMTSCLLSLKSAVSMSGQMLGQI